MTRMYESPISTRQRRTSRFHGDKFLRFTPEESCLIARTESVHGYDPHQPGTTLVLDLLTPPRPLARGRGRGRSFFWRYLLRRVAAILSEWAED